MQTLEKLKLLQTFTGHSLRNADGLRYPYNLSKIHKMIKEIVKDYQKENHDTDRTDAGM